MDAQPQAQALKTKSWWRRRNWWKIGFFVTLFAFEGAREIAVIEANSVAEPNINAHLYRFGEYSSAQGIWKRTDGGGEMSRAVIGVRCEEGIGTCILTDTHMDQRWVFATNITMFPAQFSPDNITFVDDTADCVNLSFRLDFLTKKVNAIREVKSPRNGNPNCNIKEKRVDLTLGDSNLESPSLDEHFLPLLSVLLALFGD